jgi:asparagine synthase (glutamine-hydrolysing)
MGGFQCGAGVPLRPRHRVVPPYFWTVFTLPGPTFNPTSLGSLVAPSEVAFLSMCGLLGSTDSGVTPAAFEHALGLMHHRGPDASAHEICAGGVQLGHTRLAILDLDERSNQPFRSEDGRYLMVYNGEIYNFRELARKHRLTLRTSGDTEVLMHLWVRLGAAALHELNGMFAFVIYDTHTRQLFAARDRLGVKPLYYVQRGTDYTFSSELAPLLELYPGQSWDEVGIRQSKKLRTFFNDRTLYRDIHMFPAGHYLEDGRLRRWWALPDGPSVPPSDEELRDLVDSAVQYRNIADVEVGSYLSGGLDSTIVAGLSEQPHTWTVGSQLNNEFSWARLAADALGTKHHEVMLEEPDFLDVARDLIAHRREPLSVPNEVQLYAMTREVREHNTVILSGEGADELFFGYDRVFRWAAGSESLDLREFDRLYSYGSHEDDEVLEDALAPFRDRGATIDVVAAFFQIAHLHGLLRRLDNSTMRCSVEGRVPFVDYRLVERMAGVPISYRMAGGEVKAPLKRVFADLVPRQIIDRKKVGFPVQLQRVFEGDPHGDRQGDAGSPAMDRWLQFNLETLGVDVHER